jgi:hypothetical protein
VRLQPFPRDQVAELFVADFSVAILKQKFKINRFSKTIFRHFGKIRKNKPKLSKTCQKHGEQLTINKPPLRSKTK